MRHHGRLWLVVGGKGAESAAGEMAKESVARTKVKLGVENGVVHVRQLRLRVAHLQRELSRHVLVREQREHALPVELLQEVELRHRLVDAVLA